MLERRVNAEAKANLPEAVQLLRGKLEKELQEEGGGAGVYSADMSKRYLLQDDSWKKDIMPEIIDGHNIADFIDADILQRLEDLEREEDERDAEGLANREDEEMNVDELGEEEAVALTAIRYAGSPPPPSPDVSDVRMLLSVAAGMMFSQRPC